MNRARDFSIWGWPSMKNKAGTVQGQTAHPTTVLPSECLPYLSPAIGPSCFPSILIVLKNVSSSSMCRSAPTLYLEKPSAPLDVKATLLNGLRISQVCARASSSSTSLISSFSCPMFSLISSDGPMLT